MELLRTIFKHQRKIAAIFTVTVAVVTAATFLMPPTYEASSQVMVKLGREYLNHSDMGEARPILALNQEEILNSEVEIMTKRDLAEKVINAIGINNIYPDLAEDPPSDMTPMEAAIIKFQKKLSVDGVKNSNVIDISFRHKDPDIAAQTVNLLVGFYKEKHIKVLSDPHSSFIEKQLENSGQTLKDSENKLEAFRQEYRVFSLGEQKSLLLKQRVELDTNLKNTNNRIGELHKRLASLNDDMKKINESDTLYTRTERDNILVDAKARLLTLQLNEQDLLKKYKESNRLVVNVRNEIKLVQDYIAEQEEDIKKKVKSGNGVFQGVKMELITAEAELESQLAKAANLKQQLAQVDGEVQSLDLREKEYNELKRQYDINEKNYQTYAARFEEARITDDMNKQKLANVSVIQEAAVPVEPVKPKKTLNIILAMIMGASAGLAVAFVSEHTAQVFSTPEITEKRLYLPVLTVVPYKDMLE